MTMLQAARRLQSLVDTASFCVTTEVWRHKHIGGRIELQYWVSIFSEDQEIRFQQRGQDLNALILAAEAAIEPAPLPEVEAVSEQVEEVLAI